MSTKANYYFLRQLYTRGLLYTIIFLIFITSTNLLMPVTAGGQQELDYFDITATISAINGNTIELLQGQLNINTTGAQILSADYTVDKKGKFYSHNVLTPLQSLR